MSYSINKQSGGMLMSNRLGLGLAIALPFFVLWLTLDNTAYLFIAIALAISLGVSNIGSRKNNKKSD